MTDPNARYRRQARREGFNTMTMERSMRLVSLRLRRFCRLVARDAGLFTLSNWLDAWLGPKLTERNMNALKWWLIAFAILYTLALIGVSI